ncbi:hypothetical protein [Natrinema sp. J7-1]|uniref:hypothetical protein n=1 Tax=Natrinema sp. J7-1 TaxID=1172566 RepID=UPI0009DCDCE0|nr:hypothetical protein [Natrinema sp. J7-1]
MKRSVVIAGCPGVAVLLAGLVRAITESTAILDGTPAGGGLYLAVGIGLPQYLLYSTSGPPSNSDWQSPHPPVPRSRPSPVSSAARCMRAGEQGSSSS